MTLHPVLKQIICLKRSPCSWKWAILSEGENCGGTQEGKKS